MARSEASDPLLAHHFALLDVPVAGLLPTVFPLKTIESAVQTGAFIGFHNIDMPTVSSEMREIKEGNWPNIHKINTGFTNAGQVRLEFGLMGYQTDMYLWMQQCIYGRIAPRRHFIVVNLAANKQTIKRATWLEDCIASEWTPMGTLSASSSEVLMESITLEVHRVRPIPIPVPLGPNVPAAAQPSLPSFG